MGSLFTDEAELSRPELDRAHGPTSDVAQFWKTYLDEFEQVSTDFDRVEEAGDLAVLEWTSSGALSTGRPIDYRGVSVLRFEDERVARFSTFYDTAAFIEPKS